MAAMSAPHDHDHDRAAGSHDHDAASHDHGHDHGGGSGGSGTAGGSHEGHSHAGRNTRRTALIVAIAANSTLLAVQVVVGLVLGSLSLLADSLHNASDVAALGIALAGQIVAARPATRRRSYGLVRAEVLAALFNGAVLMAITAWVIVEAIGRLGDAPDLDAWPLGIVGVVGLVVNGLSAWWISRSAGGNLNMRGAFWHLVADALGSLGVVIAAVGVGVFGWNWADPVASILISLLVLGAVWRLLRDTVIVLLEATPAGIDPDAVEDALDDLDGVRAVHHLHIWSIDSEQTAMTAHLVMDANVDLHQAQGISDQARSVLSTRFGIGHATLEPECHDCVAPAHDDPAGTTAPV
ncbi:cation diffusion facilitator family transporter [soil metagenome]